MQRPLLPSPRLARRFIPILSTLLAFAAAWPAGAQDVGRIAAERFTLPNGLEVVLSPDHSSQVVAVSVWYRAGSRDDPRAKAGLARLFERLMFAGSANVPEGGHAAIVTDAGGRLSAQVDEELSRFTETLPSNRLNLGLWLEADRMRSLAINDTTVGRSQSALLADLNSRVGEEAYTGAILESISSLYDSIACPGYAHPSVGTVATIEAITTADAQTFYRARYSPNNARLVVTGDFDPVATRRQIGDYFGGIPRGPDAPEAACPMTAAAGPHQTTVVDRAAQRAAVGHFFQLPPHDHADTPALVLLGIILSQGSGSRLNAEVMGRAHAAVATQGGILGDHRGPGVFGLFAVAAQGVTTDSLGALLASQAAWAAGPGLTEAELARARNIYRATEISGRERAADIADALQHAAGLHGDVEAVNTESTGVMRVSLADLKRVAATWLNPQRALTLIVQTGGAS